MKGGPILVLLASALSACAGAPPAIGSHLPGPFSAVSGAFDQRVKAQFPIGSDETALRAVLTQERFVIIRDRDSPFSFTARYGASELVCRADWTVRWSVFEGKIATIGGGYQEICL
jgi:hypothetical protein